MRFNGKIILITGAASGMGEMHVKKFINEGAFVYIADINKEKGKKLEKELGEKSRYIYLDVTSEESWKEAVNEIKEEKLDVLINNAGVTHYNSIEVMDLAEYMRVININQVSVYLGMKYSIPLLKKGTNPSIINIGSVTGLKGSAYGYAYVSSKFAVRGLTKCAALELAKYNIRVNSVLPGAIHTPMLDNATENIKKSIKSYIETVPLKRMGETEEVSNLILFLASDEAKYLTGSEYIIDGGVSQI